MSTATLKENRILKYAQIKKTIENFKEWKVNRKKKKTVNRQRNLIESFWSTEIIIMDLLNIEISIYVLPKKCGDREKLNDNSENNLFYSSI